MLALQEFKSGVNNRISAAEMAEAFASVDHMMKDLKVDDLIQPSETIPTPVKYGAHAPQAALTLPSTVPPAAAGMPPVQPPAWDQMPASPSPYRHAGLSVPNRPTSPSAVHQETGEPLLMEVHLWKSELACRSGCHSVCWHTLLVHQLHAHAAMPTGTHSLSWLLLSGLCSIIQIDETGQVLGGGGGASLPLYPPGLMFGVHTSEMTGRHISLFLPQV